MTGTLALVGGEPFAEACTFNRRLVEAVGADEIVVLPTAAAFEHPDRVGDAARDHFASFGVGVRVVEVVTRPDAMLAANAQAVRDARVILLLGSSAQHARPTLLQTPVWEALAAAFADGATVIGSEAGGQILCDPMVDDRGGAFTVGLGLVERLAFIPRHETWSPEALQRMHQMTNADVVTIGADTATAIVRSAPGVWAAEGAGSVSVRIGGAPAELGDIDR